MGLDWRAKFAEWGWIVAGLGASLFALRVNLETEPPNLVWGIVIASSCLILAGVARWASLRLGWLPLLTPLCLLWLYVAWPTASPTMAFGTGFVALVAALVRHLELRRWLMRILDALVFLIALAVYVATLAPTVLPADSGEFQIAGPLLGVAHPPGYALFTLLARLFSLLPFGEVAWRVNLMGAVTGALTLVVVNRTARRIVRTPWAGIVAASALGVSTTFWAQSTTINIRALTVLFTALCCDFLARFVIAPVGSRQGTRALTGLAVSFGLGVAHHASLAFFAPVFGAVVVWHDPGIVQRLRTWPRYLLAFLAPFVTHLYIVIRAVTGAPFGTDDLVDAGRVIDHLLGRGFGGDMFAFLRRDGVPWERFLRVLGERFLVVGNILHFQFGALLLAMALVGFVWLLWQRRKLALLLGGLFAVMVFITATYRAPQSVEYLMPAYVPVALCIGSAVALAFFPSFPLSLPSLSSSFLVALILLPIIALGQANLPSYVQLHSDRSARQYAGSVLHSAPPGAHILSCWHWYTPLRYLQLVEGERPDVTVTYIPPQGAVKMPQAWPQIIVRELETSQRPLIVTNYYATYGDLPYRFQPLGEAFLVQDKPRFDLAPNWIRAGVDLEGKVRILGYRLDDADVHPGDSMVIDLAWQPLVRLERDYSFFVHVVGADDVPLGQEDRRHFAAPTYEPGEVVVDRYEFPVYPTAAPGAYRLIAGVYLTFDDGSWQRLQAGDGRDAVTLATVSVAPSPLPPVTMHPSHKPFVGGPTLVGVDYDDTLPDQRRVYLHWRVSDRPILAQLYTGNQRIAQGWVPGDERGGYVTTVLDVPAGTTDLTVQGNVDTTLSRRGAWGTVWGTPIPLPAPRSRQHYLPFGGKLALVGASADATWQSGDLERVTLHFLGLRSVVRDYVVSVGVHGGGVTMLPSDWVPALGAIPTFKWVRGSQVRDIHLIDVPSDANGEAEWTLGIYDAFTARALPPLDERIARLGRSMVPLHTVFVQ
jgi:hypothetical protein